MVDSNAIEPSTSLKSKSGPTLTFEMSLDEIIPASAPVPSEWSQLLGGMAPAKLFTDITKPEHVKLGKNAVLFDITRSHIFQLPSFRGAVVSVDTSKILKTNLRNNEEIKDGFIRSYPFSDPWSALIKTLPKFSMDEVEKLNIENRFFALIKNGICIPNIMFSWLSTGLEVILRGTAAVLTQPLRSLLRGNQLQDGKSAFGHLDIHPTEPWYQRGIKRVLNGLSWAASIVAAPVGWFIAQPLFLAGNILSYSRFIIDGVTTLLATPFSSKGNQLSIYWVALKAIIKNTLLLAPTAILIGVTLGVAAPFIPAILGLAKAGVASILTMTAITSAIAVAAELISGAINKVSTKFFSRFHPTLQAPVTNNERSSQLPTSSHVHYPSKASTPSDPEISSDILNKLSSAKRNLSTASYYSVSFFKPKPSILESKNHNLSVTTSLSYPPNKVVMEELINLQNKFLSSHPRSAIPGDNAIQTPVIRNANNDSLKWKTRDNNLWVTYKEEKSYPENQEVYLSKMAVVADEINPEKFLIADLSNEEIKGNVQSFLQNLNKAGKRIEAIHLQPLNEVEPGLAEKILNKYQQIMRQERAGFDFPSNEVLALVENQLEDLTKNNQSEIIIKKAFDYTYVEAGILCALAQGKSCVDTSPYKVQQPSPERLTEFKNLINQIHIIKPTSSI